MLVVCCGCAAVALLMRCGLCVALCVVLCHSAASAAFAVNSKQYSTKLHAGEVSTQKRRR